MSDLLTTTLVIAFLGIVLGWAVTAIWYEWFVLEPAFGNRKREKDVNDERSILDILDGADYE